MRVRFLGGTGMKACTRQDALRKLAHVAHLYLEEDASGTEEEWRDVVAEALSVIDKRAGQGWMRLARVNHMITVTEKNKVVCWQRGENFKKYLGPEPLLDQLGGPKG